MLERVDGFNVQDMIECEDCGYLFYREDAGPVLYECSQCNRVFNDGIGKDGRFCPECEDGGKGQKIADFSCLHCGQGEKTKEVEVYVCSECYNEFKTDWEANEHWDEEHYENDNEY